MSTDTDYKKEKASKGASGSGDCPWYDYNWQTKPQEISMLGPVKGGTARKRKATCCYKNLRQRKNLVKSQDLVILFFLAAFACALTLVLVLV